MQFSVTSELHSTAGSNEYIRQSASSFVPSSHLHILISLRSIIILLSHICLDTWNDPFPYSFQKTLCLFHVTLMYSTPDHISLPDLIAPTNYKHPHNVISFFFSIPRLLHLSCVHTFSSHHFSRISISVIPSEWKTLFHVFKYCN